VLGELSVTLGQSVSAFDFASLYANLGATVFHAPAKLQYDSAGIAATVAGSILMALRAEARKAALDSAVAARANAYYGKYANQAEIIALMNQYYAPGSPGSKLNRLGDLTQISQNETDLLQAAYRADDRIGVVKSTTSALLATTTSTGDADASNTAVTGGIETTPKVSGVSTDLQTSSGATETVSHGSSLQNQAITNTDYGYRVPSLENQARNNRSQISLMDEAFAQFMANQNLPYLPQVFGNELSMIDLGVKQLQVGYLDTILMSPIDGVVTGIYKMSGDCVKRGEVVMRVEDNRSVYVVGIVICHDAINLGDTITVETTQFSNPANTVSISGHVVGVRGHRSNDDWWAVVASCPNLDGAGNTICPLNYHFDHESKYTKVTVS
jgi:hypothetical protein